MVAVLPVADPNIFSTAQRITLAQTQLQLAQTAPQMHNMYEAYYRVYSALNIRDIDGILLPQNTQMPKDPATENASSLNGMHLKAFAGQQHDAHIASHLMMGLSPILQANPMAAIQLQQHVLDHVRLKAEETVEAELFMQYGADPDRMVSSIQKEGMIAIKVAQFMQEARDLQAQLAGGEGGQDPVVALKQQELQQRAQKDQVDAQLEQQKIAMQTQKAQIDAQIAQQRVGVQQDAIDQRSEVARERLMATLVKQGGRNAT
jgi:hypothetical protein